MLYYHGSCKQDLKILKPFVCKDSVLKKPCVYLTTNRALASLYIWDKPFKWMNYGIGQDESPFIQNPSPRPFQYSIKAFPDVCIHAGENIPKTAPASLRSLFQKIRCPVESSEYIGDAWKNCSAWKKAGALRIQRYETLSQKRAGAGKAHDPSGDTERKSPSTPGASPFPVYTGKVSLPMAESGNCWREPLKRYPPIAWIRPLNRL